MFPVLVPTTTDTYEKIYSLGAGYYGVKFSYTTMAGSTSYQSMQYGCPTTTGFTDSSCIF